MITVVTEGVLRHLQARQAISPRNPRETHAYSARHFCAHQLRRRNRWRKVRVICSCPTSQLYSIWPFLVLSHIGCGAFVQIEMCAF